MIRAPRSLLARILWWHGLAVVVTALAVSIGVYLFLDATADHLERQMLRAQAVAVRGTLGRDAAGRPSIAAANRTGSAAMAGMSLILLDARGVRLDRSPAALPLAVARIPRGPRESFFRSRSRRSVYAGLSLPVVVDGARWWIVVIQNLDHPANVIDDIVRQFLLHGLTIVLPLLLVLLGVDAIIIRRALRPVRRASALVATIAPAQLDVRVTDPTIPTEVAPLAEAVNTALDRITAILHIQRDFTADAAHELRTPITVARVRAMEIADPAVRQALIADLDGLTRTVGNLLEIAELDSLAQVPREPTDLAALARQSVAAIAPLAFRAGKAIALAGADAPVVVAAYPQFVARALNALIENAVKHTPAGTQVTVSVAGDGLSVSDDGPGIARHEQDLVFRRFWRRDRAAHRNAGLGLAIVERVAQLHDGDVVLTSEPGRTRFDLRLDTGQP